MTYTDIARTLDRHGLTARGGFVPDPADGVPPLVGGHPARAVILIGDRGRRMWPAFARSPENADGRGHALDRWSRRVIGEVAASYEATAIFPFGGPPHHPFQRWAMRAEPVHRSPLGLLIHPDYGLWHAYRGALAFESQVAGLPARRDIASPCATCNDKPCLTTCPVAAFSGAGYDVSACAGHLWAPAGKPCRDGGCLARRACPVGRGSVYSDEQQRFHMSAFMKALPH